MRSTVVATVDLGLSWRFSPSALRGAVLSELSKRSGGDACVHSDWNGREGGENGPTLSRIPPVAYRVHNDRAHLFLWGPRTVERIAEIGRLECLIDPEDRPQSINLSIESSTTEIGLTGRKWHTYTTESPWWPPATPWGRRPPDAAPSGVWAAWLSETLTTGILGYFRALGVPESPEETPGKNTRLLVSVDRFRRVQAAWHRDDKDLHKNNPAFHVHFTTNAQLPNGMFMGVHGAEGYGEIRLLETTKLQC